MEYKNQYSQGFNEVSHRGKKLVVSSGSRSFESFMTSLAGVDFEVGYVPAGYQHRPDLISDLFYDSPIFDWVIMMFNHITDPFQGLNVGDRVLIPKI